LVSGGKDSCFNVIKCISLGHELVCIANLCPPSEFLGEELNSFMYQSAAHELIPSQQECFDVPMIRRQIRGVAIDQSLGYDSGYNGKEFMSGDEVEDLRLLLEDVKNAYPQVVGVSCGAIVSTYQRLRLEFVCSLLNLTALCFLWQKDRLELLDDIINHGRVDAILVKVAGAGLVPSKHLGKNLQELRPTLHRLHAKYGLDVCGEGGEYETLVLDCLAFKKRIVVDNAVVVLDEEGDPSVGNLRVTSHHIVDKSTMTCIEPIDSSQLLLTAAIEFIHSCQFQPSEGHKTVQASQSDMLITFSESSNTIEELLPSIYTHRHSGLGQTSLIMPLIAAVSVREQVHSVMTQLQSLVESRCVSLKDVVFVHLYVSSMELFAAVNEEYCKWFGRNPPSRSCVAVILPDGVSMAADAVFYRDSYRHMNEKAAKEHRSVLHVQSISEWAPVCIGPYAQANTLEGSLIYVAGQIPLDPASMQIIVAKENIVMKASLLLCQLWLSLRHALRVLSSLDKRDSIPRVLCCTVYVNMKAGPGEAAVELSQEFQLRVREVVNKMLRAAYSGSKSVQSGEEDDDQQQEEWNDAEDAPQPINCPVLVVGVSGIPRGALVEVEVQALRGPAAEMVQTVEITNHQPQKQEEAVSSFKNHSFIEEVLNWPLWAAAGERVTNNSTVSVMTSPPSMKYHITSSRILRCLTVGVCVLERTAEQPYTDSDVVDSITNCLLQEISQSQLRVEFLLTLRVYIDDSISFEVQNMIRHRIVVRLGCLESFPIVMLTVPSIGDSFLIAVHFTAIDLPQLKTEIWIRTP